jgi:hypothetical protein
VGGRLDKWNFVLWSEFGDMWSNDGTPISSSVPRKSGGNFLQSSQGGYILAGYRLGSLLPRYMFSQCTSNIFDGTRQKTTVHNFGLNYQINAQSVAKLEYVISMIPSASSGDLSQNLTTAAGTKDTSGSAIYLGVDLIF